MKVIKTFRNIGDYELNGLTRNTPTCFNGEVCIEEYKITIEPIIASKEEYTERLQKLWDESDNYHDYQPIMSTAKKYGIELIGGRGNNCKKK